MYALLNLPFYFISISELELSYNMTGEKKSISCRALTIFRGVTLERVGSGGGEWSNLEVPSLYPPGARAFFSSSINGRVYIIRSLKRGASLLFFL